MFFGREQELSELGELWKKTSSSFVVCSGRRRIGKSTLVEEFAARSKCRFIEIVGLAPDEGAAAQEFLRTPVGADGAAERSGGLLGEGL